MPPNLSLRCSVVVQLFLLLLTVVTVSFWYNGYTDTLPQVQNGVMRHLGFVAAEESEKHITRPDGLLEVNMAASHPLPQLIRDAERQWESMNARQSKTLKQAVQEYRRRNGYAPPAGFDVWWSFAQEYNVKLVDEFDQITYDTTPYLALSPATFRARVDALSGIPNSFHINITNHLTNIYGPRWWHTSSLAVENLVLPFSGSLPDLVIHANSEEPVIQWIGEDFRRAAAQKAKEGQYFTEEELQQYESTARNPHTDLKNVCLPDDPIFTPSNNSNTPTFIASHLTSMSPCSNPQTHDTPPLSFDQRAKAPRLVPQFVVSKMRPDSGFVLPGPGSLFDGFLLQESHTWDERKGTEKLFWRGTPTGWHWSKGFARTRPEITWRDGVRPKLALMFGEAAAPGESPEVEVLVEDQEGLVMRKVERRWLNERWMDVGFIGEPIHCDKNDGTCDEMKQAPMWKEADKPFKGSERKYVIDVDSQSRSERFHKYITWGNVVFKATLYTEWNHKWLIPYYHYIPVQTDYSDLYNHMAFFLGDPTTGAGGHEDTAKKISRRASTFAKEYWRSEDMQAYMFRLLLEYARLLSDDREAASFRL